MGNHHEQLLGVNLLQYVQNKMATDQVAWYHMGTTALPTDVGDYQGSFSHLIFKDSSGPISNLFEPAFTVLCAALDREGQQLKDLYRIRLGMVTRTPHRVTHQGHVDDGRPHRTGLFYLIDSDGDTLIYRERRESAQYTVETAVTPKQNTWHSFDGTQFHSSQSPIQHEKRLVCTFNYTVY